MGGSGSASAAAVSTSATLRLTRSVATPFAGAYPRIASTDGGGGRGGVWAFTSHAGAALAAWDARLLGRGPAFVSEGGVRGGALWLECDAGAVYGRGPDGGLLGWDLGACLGWGGAATAAAAAAAAGPGGGTAAPAPAGPVALEAAGLRPAPPGAPLPLMAAAPPGTAWSHHGRVALAGVVGRAVRRSSPVRAPEEEEGEGGEAGGGRWGQVVRVVGPAV